MHYPVEPSSYYPVLIAITPTYPNDLAHGPITHQEMGGNPIYQTNQNQPSASKEGNEQQDVAGNEKIGISALNLDWNSSESSLISPFSSVSSPILSALHNSFNSVLDKTLSLNSLEYGVIASHGFVVIEIPDDLMDPWPIDLLEDTISWVRTRLVILIQSKLQNWRLYCSLVYLVSHQLIHLFTNFLYLFTSQWIHLLLFAHLPLSHLLMYSLTLESYNHLLLPLNHIIIYSLILESYNHLLTYPWVI